MARDRSAALVAVALLALGTTAGCGASKSSAKPADAALPTAPAAPAAPATPPTAADLRARLLTPADLPAGFVADDVDADADGVMSSTDAHCRAMTDLMNSQGHAPGAIATADASFTRSQFGPNIATGLAGFATPQAAQKLLDGVTAAMGSCTRLTETDEDGSTYDYLVTPLTFPKTGDGSGAIRMVADVADLPARVDLVLVRVDSTLLYVADTGFGNADPDLTQQVVTSAVAKVRDPSARPAPTPARPKTRSAPKSEALAEG